MREIRVHMGTFDYTIICIIEKDKKKVLQYLKWKFDDKNFTDGLSTARGCVYHRDGWVPILWIPKKPTKPQELATLSHEALHAVAHCMRWANIPFNEDTEEVYAHAQAFIITMVLKKLK